MTHDQAVKRLREQADTLCATRRPFKAAADELQRVAGPIFTLQKVRTPGRLSIYDLGSRPPSEARPFLFALAECRGCGRCKVHEVPWGKWCSNACRAKRAKAAARERKRAAEEAANAPAEGAHPCDGRLGTPAPLPPTSPAGVYATVRLPDHIGADLAQAAPWSRLRITVAAVELIAGCEASA